MSSKNQNTKTLTCMGHVKRSVDPETGVIKRPDCPSLYSDTCFLGDNSGSMHTMGRAPEDGARLFAEQYHALGLVNKGQPPTHLAFAVFSNTCVEVYSGDPGNLTQKQIDQCAYSMRPTNMTRFYDSAVEQIVAQAKRIRVSYGSLSLETRRLVPLDQYASVVFATLTDGQDNRSSLCDEAALKRAFDRHKTEFGAKILFIAANMSAEGVGSSYGLAGDSCLQMGTDQFHSQEAFKAVTGACLREASSSGPPSYRSVPSRPTFTSLQRMTSCGLNEAQRYSVQGHQYTAPVKGAKGNSIQPKGSPQPPSPLAHAPLGGRLRRQNAIFGSPAYP